MARRKLRLLHTSDVHLGSHGYHGAATHHKHCICPLLAVGQLAEQHAVDGVLVVGDLFDHTRVDEKLVLRAFDALEAMVGFSVLIAGNHDVHDENSLYHTERHGEALGQRDIVFFDELEGRVQHVADGQVKIWARAMDEHSSKYRPLHGVAERGEHDGWFLVLGHGLHIGDDSPDAVSRSSLITASDIAATGADYVALGHHHVLTDVSAGGVPAFYCGAPSGYPGGQVLLVELCPESGVSATPLPVTVADSCPHEV
ncbi:MAG: exonuclease SbcCD subunit D [Acidimicrobiia bacterium]